MKQHVLAILAAVALAGCAGGTDPAGEGSESRAAGVISGAQRVFGGLSSDNTVSAPRSVPGGFTAEAVAAEPSAYRLVQINALGLQEVARVVQENGDEITLAFQSGPTAAYDGGVLVATRGLVADLMTIESAGVIEALRAGGGTLDRRMETLTAQDQILTDTFRCTIVPAGSETISLGVREAALRRFNEECRSPALVFNNIYWLGDGGEIVASRQYVSPTVAYLRSNRL